MTQMHAQIFFRAFLRSTQLKKQAKKAGGKSKYWHQKNFKKNCLSAKNGYVKIVQGRAPLSRQGVKSLIGGASCICYCVKAKTAHNAGPQSPQILDAQTKLIEEAT